MRIRTALKICRRRDSFKRGPHYCFHQHQAARVVGRRKWLDKRFPFVPSEKEVEQQGEMMCCIFKGLLVALADEKGLGLPDDIREGAMDFSQLKGSE